MGLPDLVQAKKTQRDKDWPMIRRLVEVNYFANREAPTKDQIRFWFLELRTTQLLIELVRQNRLPSQLLRQRPLLKALKSEDESLLAKLLIEEEEQVRNADRRYWMPLKKELETCGTLAYHATDLSWDHRRAGSACRSLSQTD